MNLPRGAKANIMGKDGSLVDIIVPMNRIDPVNHGDPEPARERNILQPIDHVHPILGRGLGEGHRTTAAKDTTDRVVPQYLGGGSQPVQLGHLADLLREGHPAHQVPYPRVDGLRRVLVLHVLAPCLHRQAQQQHQSQESD